MPGARAFQADMPGERHSMRLARQVAEVGARRGERAIQ